MATNLESIGGDAESLWDWVVANQRRLGTIAGVVVVLGGIVLFWRESVSVRNQRAETAFESAQSAFFSGNTPLAKSDLDKLVTRYPSTPGGVQARLLLAQILYGDGKFDEGIKQLEEASRSGAAARFAAAIEERMGAGYADLRKFDDAARHYLSAAERAQFPVDKMMYQAEAARVYQLAGKSAEARKLWTALAENPESPVSSEARVRLGEIDAKAAVKN